MYSHEKRFEMWFADPLEFLDKKSLFGIEERDRDFNGGFIAMSIGLFLFERFYRVKSITHDDPPDPTPGDWDSRFKKCASIDLNIDFDFLEAFWAVFRNGIQHQGMPRKTFRGYKDKGKIWHYWDISKGYPDLPHVHWKNKNEMVICINPWGFAHFMVKKFRNNKDLLEIGFNHAFGEVRSETHHKCYEVVPRCPLAHGVGYSPL